MKSWKEKKLDLDGIVFLVYFGGVLLFIQTGKFN